MFAKHPRAVFQRLSTWTGGSIAQRLAIGFAGMIAMLLVLAAVNSVEFRGMAARFGHLVEVSNRKVDLAYQMQNHINEMAVQARSISLLTDPKDVQAEVVTLKRAEAAYLAAEKALAEALTPPSANDQELRLLEDIRGASRETIPLVLRAAKEGQEGANMEAAETLMQRVRPKEQVWRSKVAELVAVEQALSLASYREAVAGQTRAQRLAGALVLLAITLGILLGWRITRSVRRPIDQAIKVAERIAAGDLNSSVEVKSDDEIGRLLRALSTMQDGLRAIVGQIRESVDSIRGASSDVASGNLDLSRRTETAASSLQQTASSVSLLATNVRATADAVMQGTELATSGATIAQRGGGGGNDVVRTMNAINASSKKISDITGVIDGIAFQTNILALNAAVEAARAGEQGRGFAVVAAEVRALAGRSADAAKEIKALIAASARDVELGAVLVTDAGVTMGEVVSSVGRVTHIIGEISAASSEQALGIDTINTAVSRLDQMTQQNAALVEQSSAAAESLKSQAVLLGNAVLAFQIEETPAE